MKLYTRFIFRQVSDELVVTMLVRSLKDPMGIDSRSFRAKTIAPQIVGAVAELHSTALQAKK